MERHASWGYCGVKWLRKQCENNKKDINSLWPGDTTCRHRSGSTFVQIMACCLRAPSHYLNQRWLIISEVQWYSRECNFIRDTSTTNLKNYFENYSSKISLKSPRGQWVNCTESSICYVLLMLAQLLSYIVFSWVFMCVCGVCVCETLLHEPRYTSCHVYEAIKYLNLNL